MYTENLKRNSDKKMFTLFYSDVRACFLRDLACFLFKIIKIFIMFFYDIELLWVRGPFCGQTRNNFFANHATMFSLLRNMQYAVLFLLQE